jgi:hypothetical protein
VTRGTIHGGDLLFRLKWRRRLDELGDLVTIQCGICLIVDCRLNSIQTVYVGIYKSRLQKYKLYEVVGRSFLTPNNTKPLNILQRIEWVL